jgi:hypothetical protein
MSCVIHAQLAGYCLFILHCYCEANKRFIKHSKFDRAVVVLQDAMVSVPTKPCEDLYSSAEATTLHQFQGTFSDTSKGTSLGFTQHPVDLAWYF